MEINMNLTRQAILAVASNQDVFKKGEICFKMNLIKEATAERIGYGLSVEWKVFASVSDMAETHHCNALVHSNGTIKEYGCSCMSNSIWRGACKHVVALLFLFIKRSQEDNLRILQERSAVEFISNFEKKMLNSLDSKLSSLKVDENPVQLVAELHVETDHRPLCSLQVGRNRLYVVKNIDNFLTSISRRESVSYGKSLSFEHALWAFDRESQKLIELISKQEQAFIETSDEISPYYSSNTYWGREIPLFKAYADAFFKIHENKTLTINCGGVQYKNCLVVDGIPEFGLSLSFNEARDEIVLMVRNKNYVSVEGEEFGYFIGGGKIFRTRLEDFEILDILLDSFAKSYNKGLIFSGNSKHGFCNSVAPRLKELGLLEQGTQGAQGPALIAEAESPPETKIYLDCEGKDVSCKLEFIYDGKAFNPMLSKDASIQRNNIEEYKIFKLLELYGFRQNEKKGCYILSGEYEIYSLYRTGVAALNEYAEVFATDSFSKKSVIPPYSKTKLGIRIKGGLLELNVGLDGYSLQDLTEALSSFEAKKKYHRLKDGRFIDLENESVAAVAELVSELNIGKRDIKDDKILVPQYRALYLEQMAKDNENLTASKDTGFEQLIKDFQPDKGADGMSLNDEDIQIPASLENILRNYQKTGFRWLKVLAHYGFGGILADEMGLGKTVQVIALLLSEKENFQKPSLVVAPTSLAYNWEHEFKRFAPEIETAVLLGTAQKRREILELSQNAQVFITTYDMLKRDIENYSNIEFQYVIADEAQYIKNPGTQNATSIKMLNSEARFALTGTPIENSLMELWSIFDFIMPGYLYSSTKFSKHYESPIIKDASKESSQKLKKQISPFILRRLKKEVLTELPDKLETTLYAEMGEAQKKIYTALLLQARGELDTWGETDKLQILAQLTRLRQVCCHPVLFSEKFSGNSGKMDMTLETISSAIESGHRILLFSQFTAMLAILQSELQKNKISFFYLDGSTPAKNRGDMVKQFNDGNRDIFLISLRAGGTGLNLVGADVVIHYDQWWNPAVMQQASDRAHRYGQTKEVQIINMITKDSIEEKIMELQNRKKDLVDTVIQEGGSFINKMSLDEIKELFS